MHVADHVTGHVADALIPPVSPNFDRPVYCVMGLMVDAISPGEAVECIAAAIRERRRCFYVTPNMSFVTASRADRPFWDSVLRTDLSVADGMPLVWISRILGLPIRRVAGSDLFASLLAGAAGPLSFFFFGGAAGRAQRACQRINRLERDVRCKGYAFPGFGSLEDMSDPKTIQAINKAGADILTVSIGVKKGQLWIAQNERRVMSPVIWYGGAAVNFAAETLKRAPGIVSRSGFEWLWRIREEPSLWRRYFNDLKTLLRLLTFKVIPCAVYQLFNHPGNSAVGSARLEVSKSDQHYVLRLGGAWIQRNLGPLRDTFRRAVEDGLDLVLDLEELTYCDAAFLGLVMVAYGHQSRCGRRFSISTMGRKAQTLLRLHGCEFLTTPQ
jgi:N-acetylglucosaminyldiphosphoundecaprenol N-acetyl-beta-D-mannosaminyltransferase